VHVEVDELGRHRGGSLPRVPGNPATSQAQSRRFPSIGALHTLQLPAADES
jgi:hypothetical protein